MEYVSFRYIGTIFPDCFGCTYLYVVCRVNRERKREEYGPKITMVDKIAHGPTVQCRSFSLVYPLEDTEQDALSEFDSGLGVGKNIADPQSSAYGDIMV